LQKVKAEKLLADEKAAAEAKRLADEKAAAEAKRLDDAKAAEKKKEFEAKKMQATDPPSLAGGSAPPSVAARTSPCIIRMTGLGPKTSSESVRRFCEDNNLVGIVSTSLIRNSSGTCAEIKFRERVEIPPGRLIMEGCTNLQMSYI
jgi:hypothetical protein